jgi:hypothetical protein
MSWVGLDDGSTETIGKPQEETGKNSKGERASAHPKTSSARTISRSEVKNLYLKGDFPSALLRFLWCVGVRPNVIPPHRPNLNAYVERFHRSLSQECLQVHRPGTLSEVVSLTEAYLSHYNSERPNQARSCGNQPPRVACPTEPSLPAVPQTVDPDRWLIQINRQAFARTIRANGKLTINREDSSVSRSLAGKPGHMLGERRPEAV